MCTVTVATAARYRRELLAVQVSCLRCHAREMFSTTKLFSTFASTTSRELLRTIPPVHHRTLGSGTPVNTNLGASPGLLVLKWHGSWTRPPTTPSTTMAAATTGDERKG
ncbi:hypothetical protein E2C01_007867 [Portunus trituberculatus]|uniref:Uncharacterized protein n=1 Tax=Portunus trituberculatus TaxID=210409 RepID=A0A5B7D2C3_PORTR|nr:hypothetical protein [Portunus trituberculatus]